jgi:hypothetical protein
MTRVEIEMVSHPQEDTLIRKVIITPCTLVTHYAICPYVERWSCDFPTAPLQTCVIDHDKLLQHVQLTFCIFRFVLVVRAT